MIDGHAHSFDELMYDDERGAEHRCRCGARLWEPVPAKTLPVLKFSGGDVWRRGSKLVFERHKPHVPPKNMTERTVTFDDDEWQLVPLKPTPVMLAKALGCTAAFLDLSGSKATVNFKKMSIRYRAMLSAAPCPYEKATDFDLNYECALAERYVTTLLASQRVAAVGDNSEKPTQTAKA